MDGRPQALPQDTAPRRRRHTAPAPTPRPRTSLSLIIPAYNEGPGIRRAVREADEALAGLGYDYEILVVDDGSTDDTARAVAEAALRLPRVRLLRHADNRGYGAAL